ncbi:hypothetical protein R1flu_024135 [Riccia fluitans]|uniref:Uncharacterized protein n=1 Tax=Riccia fluitans TaxID=41844 RepID=A0ABD1XU07_9MARC
MSGIRRRSRRQSDVPPEEPLSQRHRRAISPIIEVPSDEAMEMIDRLVQGEETNSRVGAIVGREDGKLLDMHAKLVICQALKWIGRSLSLYTSTTLVLLALAHVDPLSPNLMPDWYAWVFEQISFRLNHKNEDRASFAKDRLKEDLLKVQDILADAEQWEEPLRAEHERLQEEYFQEKAA